METAQEKIINGVDVPELGKAIHTFRHTPELAHFEFRVKNRWQGDAGHSVTTISEFFGVGQEHMAPTRPFKLEADEPHVLLGKDQGPNPVEHLINALAACLTGAMVYHAAARGLRLESVESELEGEIDIRGFLGIDPNIRKGYQNIRVTFRVQSDAPAAVLEECARFSPVLDVVMNGTNVNLQVIKVGAEEQMAAERVSPQPQPPA